MVSGARFDDEPFFHREGTRAAIKELATTNSIVLFVGAGLSVDQGLPTWSEIVESLIGDSSYRIPNVTDEARNAFTKYLTTMDLLAGGSIAKAIMGPELLDLVRNHLYFDDERKAQRPATGGIFANAVAAFALYCRISGDCDVTLITTNYDSLIEEAFSNSNALSAMMAGHGLRVVPVFDETYVAEQSDVPIYHIHGFVPRQGIGSKDVVISERDYGAGTNLAWSADLLDRVRSATWLILGASIQDPHLSRHLSRTAQANETATARRAKPVKRYAASALQSQPWSHEETQLRDALLWADAQRLATLGVEAIQADFFMQIPHLLNEVRLARSEGLKKYMSPRSDIRYGQRLMKWWGAIQKTRLADSTDRSFAKSQAKINELMLAFRGRLETELSLTNQRAGSERIKVELWVRNPLSRCLELRGSSEYVSTERFHTPARPLSPSSSFASVKAFCYGSIQHVSIPAEYSRWQHFVGIPLQLPSWRQLPVGTLTIASTHPKETSLLYKAEGKNLSDVYAGLGLAASEYLQP